MASIEERVVSIVAKHANKDASQIQMEHSFTNDLGFDSLEMVEMAMDFEDEFDLEIPDEDNDKIQTVGQAVSYVKEHSGAPAGRKEA